MTIVNATQVADIQIDATQVMPTHLIYEMAEVSIYYHNFQAVLRRTSKVEEIIGSSYIQSFAHYPAPVA